MTPNPPLPPHLADRPPDVEINGRDPIPSPDFLLYIQAYPAAEFTQAVTNPVEGWWGVKLWIRR